MRCDRSGYSLVDVNQATIRKTAEGHDFGASRDLVERQTALWRR